MKLKTVKTRHLWSGGGSSVSIGPTCTYSHYSRRAKSLIGLIVPESANTTAQFVLRSSDFFCLFVFCFSTEKKNQTRKPGWTRGLLYRSDFLQLLTPSPSPPASLLLQTVKEERTWSVRAGSGELLQALLAWVRTQWEAMFGIKLHTSSSSLQDGAT